MDIFSVLLLIEPLIALLLGFILGFATRRGWFGLFGGFLTIPLLFTFGLSWNPQLLVYIGIYAVIGMIGSWIGNKLSSLHRSYRL